MKITITLEMQRRPRPVITGRPLAVLLAPYTCRSAIRRPVLKRTVRETPPFHLTNGQFT